MDNAYGFDRDDDFGDDSVFDVLPPVIGTAERRMHVLAYEYWTTLLAGRPFPAIGDLDLAKLPEFEPRSVFLDYSGGHHNPKVTHIGETLRNECGADAGLRSVADVPRGSLLSRLTDHFLEIIGTRAPIGFEAEFTNHKNLPTLYRGILMPFSSDGRAIDHVLGVINWKHALSPELAAELKRQMRSVPGPVPTGNVTPVWGKRYKH